MNQLFHASPVRGLKFLEPQDRSKQQPNDPPRVYVARQRRIAVGFMVGQLNDSWSASGSWDGRKSWWLVVGNEGRFREMEQRGGSLYTVPVAGFKHDLGIGLGDEELYATHPVPVLDEEQWDSALTAMLHYGLKVLFVPKLQFSDFMDHPDQWELMQKARQRLDGTFTL